MQLVSFPWELLTRPKFNTAWGHCLNAISWESGQDVKTDLPKYVCYRETLSYNSVIKINRKNNENPGVKKKTPLHFICNT